MTTTTGGPPIGLLLRTLDRLIEERFERTVTARGVSRRQWQLLNVLAKGDSDLDALTNALAAFLASGESARRHLDPLVADGVVRADAGAYALTASGRALLTDLSADVQQIRDRTVAGLPDGAYQHTLTTLQAMIDNLGSPL